MVKSHEFKKTVFLCTHTITPCVFNFSSANLFSPSWVTPAMDINTLVGDGDRMKLSYQGKCKPSSLTKLNLFVYLILSVTQTTLQNE